MSFLYIVFGYFLVQIIDNILYTQLYQESSLLISFLYRVVLFISCNN